ncbi:MAG TPA: hypothetical protein VF286_11435, partial [Acidiphilium sp.]
SPWSLGWQIMYYSNNGPEAWYLNANSAGVMAGITPTWQKGHLFVRGEVGFMHLTQIGNNWNTTPSGSTIITGHAAGFGSSGTDRNQVLAALEAGLVF